MSLFEPLWQPVAETSAAALTDIDDTPVNGATDVPISSNWAFDHAATALAHSITDAAEIGADLADDDGLPVYDLSATANKKSLLSRFWTYISSKLSSYTGALTGSSLTVSGSDEPTYSAELLTSAGWTVNAGWAESPDDTFAHSSGTDTLTHSATIVNGTKYQVAWTISGVTAGSVTLSVGGTSVSTSATGSFGPTATSTAAFTITPTADFNGALSLVSLKAITAGSTPTLVIKDSAGTVIYEQRGNSTSVFLGTNAGQNSTTGNSNTFIGKNSGALTTTGAYNTFVGYGSGTANSMGNGNTFVGHNAGSVNTTGYNNNFMGVNSGSANTTGMFNSFIGADSGVSNTTGIYNCFVGQAAGRFNTTGEQDSFFGSGAGYSNTTGTYNTFLGYSSGNNISTGSGNSCIGYQAGSKHANGVTGLTDPEHSVYIGYSARGKDNDDSNSVVIGGNTPIGLGANTTVIGTSATTLTRLYGDVATGVDAPSAAFHAIKTTEQLRLGYDASNYLAATVSSTGNLTLDTTGGTIYTPDTIENTVAGAGIVLKSPDGTRYRLTVANGGTLSIAAA